MDTRRIEPSSGTVSRRELVAWMGALGVATPALGELGAGAAQVPPVAVEAATVSAVEALLRRVEHHWRSLEFTRLEELWDTSRPPLYIAEEATEIHRSFDALRQYWAAAEAATLKMGLALGRATLVPLDHDLLSAVFPLHWECVLKGESAPLGGDNRAAAVLRRTAAGWRFTQYVEAPLAPIVYVERLYRRTVSPGFGAAR